MPGRSFADDPKDVMQNPDGAAVDRLRERFQSSNVQTELNIMYR